MDQNDAKVHLTPRGMVFVGARPVSFKRVEAWTVWVKRVKVLEVPWQGAQGGGG